MTTHHLALALATLWVAGLWVYAIRKARRSCRCRECQPTNNDRRTW